MKGQPKKMTTREVYEQWLNREAGIPLLVCAQMAGVSRTTLLRELAAMRQKLGRTEKLPNGRRARSPLARPTNTNNQ